MSQELFPEGPMELPGESEQPRTPSRKRRLRFNAKKVLFMVIGLLVAGAVCYGGWKFLTADKQQPAVSSQTVSPAPDSSNTQPSFDDVPEASETKQFKGNIPRLELTYPATWTLTDSERGIRLESPQFTYRTVGGDEIPGNFRLYIRQGARPVDSKYIGRGVAIQPSEKLTYENPATGQRPDTNLTAFGLDTPDHFAYFFIAGNYSLQKNDTLGPDYGKEAETYIIAGGYSAPALTEDVATNPVALDYYAQTNAYKQALEIIKSLKLL